MQIFILINSKKAPWDDSCRKLVLNINEYTELIANYSDEHP